MPRHCWHLTAQGRVGPACSRRLNASRPPSALTTTSQSGAGQTNSDESAPRTVPRARQSCSPLIPRRPSLRGASRTPVRDGPSFRQMARIRTPCAFRCHRLPRRGGADNQAGLNRRVVHASTPGTLMVRLMDAGPRGPGCQRAWVSFSRRVGTYQAKSTPSVRSGRRASVAARRTRFGIHDGTLALARSYRLTS
jgi:hypothetical protein